MHIHIYVHTYIRRCHKRILSRFYSAQPFLQKLITHSSPFYKFNKKKKKNVDETSVIYFFNVRYILKTSKKYLFIIVFFCLPNELFMYILILGTLIFVEIPFIQIFFIKFVPFVNFNCLLL